MLSETQHGSDKKGDEDGRTEHKKANPIEFDEPKCSVGFKPAPGSHHLDGCA